MIWNRKRNPPIRSLIGEGIILRGNIDFVDGMRVDGEVHGDLVADRAASTSMLVVGDKAKVYGKVNADHVIIVGEVIGPVHCSGLLELQPSARITGDVFYQLLEMHPGAVIEGELRPLKNADKPPLTLAASNDA